jgi:hypothetical protein
MRTNETDLCADPRLSALVDTSPGSIAPAAEFLTSVRDGSGLHLHAAQLHKAQK